MDHLIFVTIYGPPCVSFRFWDCDFFNFSFQLCNWSITGQRSETGTPPLSRFRGVGFRGVGLGVSGRHRRDGRVISIVGTSGEARGASGALSLRRHFS